MIQAKGSPSRQSSTTAFTLAPIAITIANHAEYFSMKSPSSLSSDATPQTLGLVVDESQDAAQILKLI